MSIRSTNPTQSFSDEQNVRSMGNPFSAFNDFFSSTGIDAARRSHPNGPIVATSSGGAEFKVPTAIAVPGGGGYVYHIFTDTSTPATFEVEYGASINVLMVGGGGAGRNGGGGAGGIAHAVNLPTGIPSGGSLTPFIATITVGAGHEHPAPASTPTTTGGNSTFAYTPLADPSTPITITALGGGNGGANGSGSAGGSGGGSGRGNVSVFPTSQYFYAGPGQQPTQNPGLPFVTNYGNGNGSPPTNTLIPGTSSGYYRSFGGGGASEPSNAGNYPVVNDDRHKNGGAGQPFTIVPGPIIYTYAPSPLQTTLGTAWRDALGPTGIMGGGGGGTHHDSTTAGGAGGAGGGGAGGYDALTPDGFLPNTWPSPVNAGIPGVDYTGSGGGAWHSVSPGNGGKGIIIVYYYVGD